MKRLQIVSLIKTFRKSPFLAGSLVMIVGTNVYNFGQTIFHLAIGRLLGRAEYAEMAAILSTLSIIAVVEQVLDLTVVKFVSSGKNKRFVVNFTRWFFYWSMWIGILLAFVFWVIARPLSEFLHVGKPGLILILSPAIFLLALLNTARATLRGLLRFNWYVINLFFEIAIKLLFMFLLVFLGYGVFGAMAAVGIGVLCAVFLAYFPLSRYLLGRRQKAPNIRPLLKYSIPVFFLSMALTSMYSTDIILVKHFFLSEDAGLYAAISKLGSIAFFATGPIASVMFPYISRNHSRGEPYDRFFYLSIILVLVISIPIVVLYKVAPVFVINLLYGPEFISGAGILWWFSVYMLLIGLVMLLMQFYLSTGKTEIMYPFVGAALLQIILIWFIHPTLLSVIQASILSAALLLVALLVYFPYQKRLSS